jgi:arsenate reductase (thioredoxin)
MVKARDQLDEPGRGVLTPGRASHQMRLMRSREVGPRPGLDPRADDLGERLRALADPIRLRLLGILARGDCPVTSLAAALGVGQSLISFHLGALREAGLARLERRGRFTYARVDPAAVGLLFAQVADLIGLELPMSGSASAGMRVVVFASQLGSGRPLLAASVFNQLAPPGWYAVAAGTHPADQALAKVARVLRDHGTDVGRARPQPLTQGLVDAAELLVTFDDPALPASSTPRQAWEIPAVTGAPIATVRAVYDQLYERVVALLGELGRRDPLDNRTPGEQVVVRDALSVLHARFGTLLGAERVAGLVREEAARVRAAPNRPLSTALLVEHAGQRLRALAQAERRLAKRAPEILFVCVHNAGRSQMAAAFAERLGRDRVHAWSAGSQPADQVHPEVTAVMAEVGIDLAGQVPKPWTNDLVRAADVVVTMGCGDDCPHFPGVRYVEWAVPDPAGKPLATARRIRDQLRGQVEALLNELLGDSLTARAVPRTPAAPADPPTQGGSQAGPPDTDPESASAASPATEPTVGPASN